MKLKDYQDCIKATTLNVYDYMELLCDRLVKLKTHNSYAKQQSKFFKELETQLNEGEFIICFDFVENYAFVVQNADQPFHWNNNQASISTTVIHQVEDGQLEHKSLGIISDNLTHDTFSVYQYQKIIIDCLRKNFVVTEVIFVTDGASQHLKNETHGKPACDGIVADLKRGARRASLQHSSRNHILTRESLFKWAKRYCKETEVFSSGKETYELVREELQLRFETAQTIPGTLQFHAFMPTADVKLEAKKFPLSPDSEFSPKGRKSKLDTERCSGPNECNVKSENQERL
ncbi:hypothetical protein QAD02_013795 [Eretmocerus hayati]|uniref:Uncharacterized protein n=1 Tax=Eretmocerus hayati TaxID=131215 RepID=A0ACC2P3G5_9HYME|nr:hypothetical protein QAD02_013795 [Eretmocerus hayati]